MKHSIDTDVLSSYSLKEQDNLSYILACTQKIDPFSGVSYLQLKKNQIERYAEKLIRRFPHSHNQNLLKTIDYIFAILEDSHLMQFRDIELLQLIRTIYLFQYSYELLDQKNHSFVFRFFPTHIFINLYKKKILSVIVKSRKLRKYDCLEDENVFSIIQNQIPNVRMVPGSSYSLYNQKDACPILYFQIEKISHNSFSTSEIFKLKQNFGAYLPNAIETRLPSVFAARNEEEIFKNILVLAKEFTTLEDLPQVIISQENSSEYGIHFLAIVVRIQKKRQPFFSKSLQNMNFSVEYKVIREQTVRFFENTYPIVASILSINIPMNSQVFRRNRAINFYTSRRIVSQFLQDVLGQFRDYNGGMIIKQQELLFALKAHTIHLGDKSAEFIEDFFYSLNPVEMQATIPLDDLIFIYSCFLRTIPCKTKLSGFCHITYRNSSSRCTCLSIATREESIEPLQLIPEILHDKVIIYDVYIRDTRLLGYFYQDCQDLLQQTVELSLKKKYRQISLPIVPRISFSLPILSLDPRLGGDESSIALLQLLFEGLMQYTKEGTLICGLASSVHIDPSYKYYSFVLRETFWSNRSQVTANDFLYTWKKTLHPKFFSPFAHLLYPIKNAKAIKEGRLSPDLLGVYSKDPLSLTLCLEYPITQFLEFLTHPVYFPICSSTDAINPNWFSQVGSDYVCNGPFTLESRKETGYYLLQKNPLFWNQSSIVNNEMIISYDQPKEAYDYCKRKEIDYYGPLPSSWKNNGLENQITFPMNSIYCYLYNTHSSYFKNENLRLAFASAINRKKILETIYAKTYVSLYEERKVVMNPPTYNLSRALEYYKIAIESLPPRQVPIRIIYLDSPTRRHIIQLLCAEWTSLFGIEFRLHALPWNQLIARMLQGNFDIGGLIWQSSFSELSYMLFSLTEELLPFTNWEREEYKETLRLIKKYGNSAPLLMQKAIEILEKYVPIIPIFSLNYMGFSKREVCNSFHKHPCNFRYFSLPT